MTYEMAHDIFELASVLVAIAASGAGLVAMWKDDLERSNNLLLWAVLITVSVTL